jgi:hypothetical protein
MALRLNGVTNNSVNVAPTPSTTVTIRVLASGDSIKTYLDGTLVNDITNSANNTRTLVGIATYRSTTYLNMNIDNFKVY